jgi:hypothetical protein
MNNFHFLMATPIVLVMVSINSLVNPNRSYSSPQRPVEISAHQEISPVQHSNCRHRICPQKILGDAN